MSPRVAVLLCVVACGRFGSNGNETNVDPPKEVLALAERDLSPAEAAKLGQHGFAILGSAQAESFHVGYTALFHAHQPVYVTADALLYAWHASYDKILMAIELDGLAPALDAMLEGLRTKLPAAEASPEVRGDLDVYLAVALSLARGSLQKPVAGGDPAQISTLFDQSRQAEGLGLTLFGEPMQFDFSMLKPRGHYTQRPQLQQYFRAMMWLGRAEIRFGTREAPTAPWRINHRALEATLLLGALFDDATRGRWHEIDATVDAFVGPSDSMSLPGLETALAALHRDIAGKSDAEIAAAFEAPAAQKIHTQLAYVGESSLAFLVFGQRFVFDSSVLGDLVAGTLDTRPSRMMPTPLDVAHVVFHNPVAHELLAPELKRYGAPYERALATHAAMALPDGSLAHLWLGALRELSPDAARDASLPAPLTSKAWGRRMLQTQLASWAELRHDNLLYAKQSFTGEAGCEFPSAYIDPYPAFYRKLEALATRARTAVARLPAESVRGTGRIDHYLEGVATTMKHLREIAERERANQPMTSEDLEFMNRMVSLDGRNIVCSTTIDPKGWYAELFYDQNSAKWHDPVIADVHTQPTDEDGNMVGHVLHVGTGMPRMMAVRIRHDGGEHTQTYRGFVSSYGELVTDKFERLTDETWQVKIKDHMVGTPPWLAEIVVGR